MKALITLLFCLLTLGASAQMDERFYFPNKDLEIPDSLRYEAIRIPVSGGDTLYNALFKPAGNAKAGVLLIHGAGGNIGRYLFMMRPLVTAGYNVFMVDFRGYGRSTGKPTHLNIAADGQLVLDAFRNHKAQSGRPLAIYGASMGSQIAAKLAHDNQAQVMALVLDGGFDGMTELAAMSVPDSMKQMVRNFLKMPYAAATELKTTTGVPKLFVHSREDQEIPFVLGERAYKEAAEPKELYVYNGAHLMLLRDDPQAVISRLNTMLGIANPVRKQAKSGPAR